MKSDIFRDEIKLIEDSKLREFVVDFINRGVPDYFFVVPASSSGKYHPEYALGEGGLVRHTKACVRIADHLLSLEQNSILSELYRDEIIVALLVHDTYKCGLGKGTSTAFEHPLIVSNMLQLFAKQYYPNPDLRYRVKRIAKLTASHMGQWNTSKRSKVVLPKPQTETERFVHMCDYLASRKDITIDVSYEPPKEKEEQHG